MPLGRSDKRSRTQRADTSMSARRLLAQAMSEEELLRVVIDMARLYGWLVYHARPALRLDGRWRTPTQGEVGFPDLILVGRGQLLAVELKTERGRLSEPQKRWLDAMTAADLPAAVWRPRHLDQARAYLAGERKAVPGRWPEAGACTSSNEDRTKDVQLMRK